MTRGCRNKPHPRELNQRERVYQDGWYADFGGRLMAPGPKTQWKEDVACGHTESHEDPECNGCKWQIGISKEPVNVKLTPEIEREARRFMICPLCDGSGIVKDIQRQTGIIMKSACPRCLGAKRIGDWKDGDATEEGQAGLAGQAGSR